MTAFSGEDGLIADQPGAAVDAMRVSPVGLGSGRGAGDEEAAGLVDAGQPRKIEDAPIHDVERAGLGHQLIEDVDLVHRSVGIGF